MTEHDMNESGVFGSYIQDMRLVDKDGVEASMSEFAEEALELVYKQQDLPPTEGIIVPLLTLMVNVLTHTGADPEMIQSMVLDEEIHGLMVALMTSSFFFGVYCTENETKFRYTEVTTDSEITPPNLEK